MTVTVVTSVPLYNGKKCTYTEAQTLADDGFQYEIIEGILLMTPAPNDSHQYLSLQLSTLLQTFLLQHPIGIIRYAPRDVRLRENLVYQPDILYISNERLAINKPQYVDGPPDLIIEILSPATRIRDTQDKFYDYEAYGVKEYWIVNPNDTHQNQFYSLQEGKYQPFYAEGTRLHSRMITGFSLDLSLLGH